MSECMYTHDDLIRLAAGWLRKRYPLVITELASTSEEPDAIGFVRGWSAIVECKAMRADFLADRRKWFRMRPGRGMGTYRYYLAPAGVVDADELPDGWGLLRVKNGRVRQARAAKGQARKAIANEMSLLLSVIRRIGQTAPEGISIRCYTYQTENRATVGIGLDA